MILKYVYQREKSLPFFRISINQGCYRHVRDNDIKSEKARNSNGMSDLPLIQLIYKVQSTVLELVQTSHYYPLKEQ